jgi:hypothetical protein
MLNSVRKFFNSRLDALGRPISLTGDIASISQDGSVDVQVTPGDITLASAKILVGNGSNVAAPVGMSVDATINNSGVVTVQPGVITYAKIQNTAAGFKVIGKKDTGAGSVEEIALGANQVLAKSGTGNIAGQTVVPAMTSDVPIGLNFGVPAAKVANRFVVSTSMKVGAYIVANPSSGDSLCRNIEVIVTIAGGFDAPGTITVVGTNYNDGAIQEVIIPIDGTVAGTKAFKTVTAVTGAGWSANDGDDQITVGFGGLVGLPVILSAAADLVMATHGTGVLNAPTVAVGATIEACTIDITTDGDGAKRLRLFYQN